MGFGLGFVDLIFGGFVEFLFDEHEDDPDEGEDGEEAPEEEAATGGVVEHLVVVDNV